MFEILDAFDDIVSNAANTYRLQEWFAVTVTMLEHACELE